MAQGSFCIFPKLVDIPGGIPFNAISVILRGYLKDIKAIYITRESPQNLPKTLLNVVNNFIIDTQSRVL
jgi:hypothetical protein